jgi:uncharacterized membrane protein required for colicin V production
LVVLRLVCKTFLSSWISPDNQSIFALSFGGIFISIWLIKKGFYRLTEASSNNDNPNALNRPFAVTTILAITAVISFNYRGAVAELQTIESLIANESLRNFITFAIVFAILVVALIALSKLLNIKIDSDNPSLMAPVYEGILRVFSSIDTLINARNVGGITNNFLGALLGLFKGGIFVLIIVLILQSMTWVTQNHAWVETSGALRTFQDWSVDIKPVLSKHLLFIELEPGDAIVEFIESEITGD